MGSNVVEDGSFVSTILGVLAFPTFNLCGCQKYVVTQECSGGCRRHYDELKWNVPNVRVEFSGIFQKDDYMLGLQLC